MNIFHPILIKKNNEYKMSVDDPFKYKYFNILVFNNNYRV